MKETKSSYAKDEPNLERERSGTSLFNKAILKKTSSLLATVMIISMLIPVLAFAAGVVGFNDVKYNSDGSVTGQVYFDSELSVSNSVYVNVYSNNNLTKSQSVNTATYSTYGESNGYYYYDFTVTDVTYSPVTLRASLDGNDLGIITESLSKPTPPPTGCTNCGGGGIFIPPTSSNGTIEVTNGTVDSDTLKKALNDYTKVTLNVKGDSVQIPASALIDASKKAGAMITIVGDNGTYILPLSVLDLEGLAKQLGVDVKDLKITIKMAKVTGTTATDIANAIKDLGGSAVANAVEFTITAEGNGKTVNVDSFGSTYVSRLLTLTSKPTKPTTGVVFDPATKQLSFVPSTFSEKDGKTIAEIKRNSNSIYTVIEMEKSFSDVNAHWSQPYVELLASKLIVDGVTDTMFEPDRNITRAEFAALLVRSLGLKTVTGATYFNDVSTSEWYSGVVGAAAQAKLIDGYEDGTFRPNVQISREELAAMVVRALKYAGTDVKVDMATQTKVLANWSDANKIIWGQNEIASAVNAGLMDGMTNSTLGTDQNATRGQSAAMLKRFLTKGAFIN